MLIYEYVYEYTLCNIMSFMGRIHIEESKQRRRRIKAKRNGLKCCHQQDKYKYKYKYKVQMVSLHTHMRGLGISV